ncbi:hypothetical protein [Enterococcus ureasiticus]|uniref:Uncharacterized protein n=1 Tax=Enterococcus ureasiticus TaxID=903984 RepID=A0A1E5GG81_9ENTE|nr:hypothetical protein [Enterococcus ureasiticus]OEG11595.1 hypothetical protein BCR21_09905 [Enterococcus ureasiticus]
MKRDHFFVVVFLLLVSFAFLVSPDQYHAEEEKVLQGIKMYTEEYNQAKQLLPEGYTFVGDSSDYSIRASRPVLLARDHIQKYGW